MWSAVVRRPPWTGAATSPGPRGPASSTRDSGSRQPSLKNWQVGAEMTIIMIYEQCSGAAWRMQVRTIVLLSFFNFSRFATPFVKDLLEICWNIFLVYFVTSWIQMKLILCMDPGPHF